MQYVEIIISFQYLEFNLPLLHQYSYLRKKCDVKQITYFKEITSRNSFKSNNGIGSSHGTDSSDSKPNELVPESGVEKGLESYSDSDSGAGVTTPLVEASKP